MAFDYNIYWTNEAVNNLELILNHSGNSPLQLEAEDFRKSLSKQINLIQQNPYLFPISLNNSRLRKAVLNKQTIVFYEVSAQNIYLIHLFNDQPHSEATDSSNTAKK